MLKTVSQHYAAIAWKYAIYLLAAIWATPSIAKPITVILEQPVYLEYVLFLQGGDPLDVTDFSGRAAGRPAVEPVLLQQALRAGGLEDRVIFTISPSYVRSINLLAAGEYALSGSSIWKTDTDRVAKDISLSSPVIDRGQYEAGIYVLTDNQHALNASSLNDIQRLTAVSNRHWQVDWRTLEEMGIRSLYSAPSWDSVISMIRAGRADFMLSPFPQDQNLALTAEGRQFIPIPDLKVILQGSRHFIIAKNHPRHKEIQTALDYGLQQLHEDGIIQKAFEQVGFFNHRTKDWKVIN